MWATIRQSEHGLCVTSQRRRGAVDRGDEPRDPSLTGARARDTAPEPCRERRLAANRRTARSRDTRRSDADQAQHSAETSNPTAARALVPALGPRRGVANHVPADVAGRSQRWAHNVRRSGAALELHFRGHDNLAEFKRCLRNSFNSLPAKYR